MSRSVPRYSRLLLDMHIPDWDAAFLREYDPRRVVGQCLAGGADSVMLYCQSHLGLCYWPTVTGTRHAAMKGADWLGESLAALKDAGKEAYGYYSVIFNNDAYLRHPDWRMQPRPTMAGGAFHGQRYGHVCPNNAQYRRFVEAQVGELLAGYCFDGFFFDMTFWPGICECAACRERFSAEAGHAVPSGVDWSDPAWCAFQAARERWMVEFAGFLTGLVKRTVPIPVYHNFAVALFNWTRGVSFDLARHCDFLGGDFYGDRDEQFLISRFMLNLTEGRPIEYMTSRCVHLTDHVNTKSLSQLQTQAFASLTCCAAFRVIDAIDPEGTVSDAFYDMLRPVFDRLAPYQPYLGGTPVEDVAVYLSDHSKMSPAEDGRPSQDPALRFFASPHLLAARGAVGRLRDAKIAVGVVTRKQLGDLGRFKVVVLPEVTRLSPEEVDAFTRFVEGGGSLYVSGQTGTHTLEGRSADFLLGRCMGIRYVKPIPGDTFYVRPTDVELVVLARPQEFIGVHEAPQQVEVCSAEVETLATVTLAYGHPDGGSIDDRRWASIHSSPPGEETRLPAITRHRFGRGTVIYSAAALERSSHHCARRAFCWLIERLLAGRADFGASTSDHVWMTVFHQPGEKRFIVHLLNYPAELPAVPVRDVRLRFGRGRDLRLTRLVQIPEGGEIALTRDASGACSALIETLDDYRMLALYHA